MAASFCSPHSLVHLLLLVSLLRSSTAAARMLLLSGSESAQPNEMLFQYHNGPMLTGKISVNLIWYGRFTPSQRAIVSDFLTSFSSSSAKPTIVVPNSVSNWWKGIDEYYKLANKSEKPSSSPSLALHLGAQILDEGCSLGKTLSTKQIVELASKGAQKDAINVVLTSKGVSVEGFCSSKCGTHGSSYSTTTTASKTKGKASKFAYIWVGNSETQCPGQCAWPFHQPIYGPQTPPLVAPNNDVGLDGMVINLGALLAGTATNPFGNGYFQGPKEAPLEAASACPGIYGKRAYPGYAGDLLVDSATGASYNANGVHGRRYLLPALFSPSKSACGTLV